MMLIGHKKRSSWVAIGFGLFVVIPLFGFLLAKTADNTEAADASGWVAGNIISDSIFTDANAMSEADIQNFLNQRIGNCDFFGQQPSGYGMSRAEYARINGWHGQPYTCLNYYYEVPKTEPGPSVPANNYSDPGGPIPEGAKSAAWIIKDAANRYGINPKVLLVKIATESVGPLTSDQWPLFSQYKYAMGSHCPDSGPGGSANCDPAYAGFSIQMYSAAELLRRYLDSMQEPWWIYKRPYQVNSILWRVVQSGCGASDVYVENKATAALYTYTPYQPDGPALANMYGTGGNCSSYGNRNFWRTYVDWFGSSRATAPYQWTPISQEVFSDPAMTKALNPGTAFVEPGQKTYVRIRAYNAGFNHWSNDNIRLGTTGPTDRASAFYDPSWLSASRPAKLKEGTVQSDGIGTFEFALQAPQATGLYVERFNTLYEGSAWLNDVGMTLSIHVVKKTTPTQQDHDEAVLESGSVLHKGDHRLSPDKHSVLSLQDDGNLVYYTDFQPVWYTNTSGVSADRLIMQTDGNLVLYDSDSKPLWHSNTAGNQEAYLRLQADGNIVVYSRNNQALWHISKSMANPDYTVHSIGVLPSDRKIYPGQSIKSGNGKIQAILQKDGNFVIYHYDGAGRTALWSSLTYGKNASYLVSQRDGNLVLYDSDGKPLWHSNTAGRGASYLVMQSDGNLVLHNALGTATWHTYTYGH